jgi:hypothetical protein
MAELTPTERAVAVVELLRSGRVLTTAEVAARYGLKRRGALALMHRVSRVAPIAQVDGHWTYIGTNSVGVARGVPGRMVE